jgi:hypothetical protein
VVVFNDKGLNMQPRDSGRVQERLLKHLERQERQQAYQRDRFFRYKLPEIHNKLLQTLLMKKIVETDNPASVSDALLKGLKKALNSSQFDFDYFIAPLRSLVSRPNPYSLYMTQYLLEVMIEDPSVIDIYGTDEEVYSIVNSVFSEINARFERTEEEINAELAANTSLVPGSREYDLAVEELTKKKLGEMQKQGA